MRSLPPSLKQVRTIIRNMDSTFEVTGITGLAGGSADAYRVDLAGAAPSLVLKIYDDEPLWVVKKEALVAEWIGGQAGVPIPRWLVVDERRILLPKRFALMTWLHGAPVRSLIGSSGVDLAYRQMGALLKRLHGSLAAAAERGPADFAELLLVPGVGARTVKSLAMVAEVVHGAPFRFSDPARFSFAHGGKDGHPFPVPLKVYDETIRVLKSAVTKAKLGESEELAAIRRLDAAARRLEAEAKGPSLTAIMAEERALSPLYGGRTVMDDAAERLGGQRPKSAAGLAGRET